MPGRAQSSTTPAVSAALIWQYAQGIWRSKGNDPTTIAGASMAARPGRSGNSIPPFAPSCRGAGVRRGRCDADRHPISCSGNSPGSGRARPPCSAARLARSTPVLVVARRRFPVAGRVQWSHLHLVRGSVYRWDGVRLEPVPGAPRGVTYGGCVAGGTLCVSANDPATGYTTLRCYAVSGGPIWRVAIAASGRTSSARTA